jgi:hypothetical protein
MRRAESDKAATSGSASRLWAGHDRNPPGDRRQPTPGRASKRRKPHTANSKRLTATRRLRRRGGVRQPNRLSALVACTSLRSCSGRHPKPSCEGPQINRQVLVSANSGLSGRVRSLPTSYPVGSCDPLTTIPASGRRSSFDGSNLHIGALTGPWVSAATANRRPHFAREN